MPDTGGGPDTGTRKWLALGIVGASVVGVVLLSGVAILTAGEERAETSRLVFSSVLPLLGTWVGTVLAFYFARENLEAATRSTLALSGVETTTPVTRVMIREADFVAYDVGTGEDVEAVPLSAVRDKMRDLVPPSRRLPIRNAAGAVMYVIHVSTLTAFAESQGQTSATIDKTVGDLIGNAEFKSLVEAVGFVAETATLADARTVMASVKYCNDVFVTGNGKREERAIGWLTNTLLAGVQ